MPTCKRKSDSRSRRRSSRVAKPARSTATRGKGKSPGRKGEERWRQLTLDEGRWGGPRKGSGPKPKLSAGVPHDARERFRNKPVHVTMKLVENLNGLRHAKESQVVRGALRLAREQDARSQGRCRLVHYAILWDHLHLIVEASDEKVLGIFVKGLAVRIARALNRLWNRKGRVFRDRYHAHVLRRCEEARNALRYVLCNGRKHRVHFRPGPDPLTSGACFRHWLDRAAELARSDECVLEAEHWLLTVGWLKHYPRFATDEVPPERTTSRNYASQRKSERRRRRNRGA